MDFTEQFERKVKNTIEKYNLVNKKDKILVACSGGKDSTTTLYLLHKFGYDVEALIIDLLIRKWSKNNLENVKKFCKEYKIKLHIINIRKEIGYSMCYIRSIIQSKKKLNNCTICGPIRRWLINKKARTLRATKLATPTAIMVGTGMGAEKGILIKGGDALETAHRLYAVVFDKTGTLTWGKPEVTDIVSVNNNEEELLKIAASVEQYSEHPLAQAIVNKTKEKKIILENVKNFKAIPGQGVEGIIGKNKAIIGKPEHIRKSYSLESFDRKIIELEEMGKTVVVACINKKVLGIIAIADTIRQDSIIAVKTLQKDKIFVYMITGDNKRTANAIAKQLGVNYVIAEVLPEDKTKHVKELQKRGKVAMVGDGINDAPALAQADIGIAIGSGTDVAMETGNIVLMNNSTLDVVRAIKLSKITISKIKQNMFWALFYNSLGIPIAAGLLYPFTGWLLSPIIAGGAMAMSSVSVVLNTLLMKRKKI